MCFFVKINIKYVYLTIIITKNMFTSFTSLRSGLLTSLTVILTTLLIACGNSGSSGDDSPSTPDTGRVSNCISPDINPNAEFNDDTPIRFKEDTSARCTFRLPAHVSISSLDISSFDFSVSVSNPNLFPEGSISYSLGDDDFTPLNYDTRFNPFNDAGGTAINILLTPASNQHGSSNIMLRAFNTADNSNLGNITYSIIVSSEDDAPIASPVNFEIFAAGLSTGNFIGTISASIPDDNPTQSGSIIYSIAEDTMNVVDGNFIFNRGSGIIEAARDIGDEDIGMYNFTVIATQEGVVDLPTNILVSVSVLSNSTLSVDSDQDGYVDAYDAFPEDATRSVSGSGTIADPYIINNIFQLQAINGIDYRNNNLNAADDSPTDGNFLYGANRSEGLTSNYRLGNDISAAITSTWEHGENDGCSNSMDQGFIPIGDEDNRFEGTFDGAGFAISDLLINHVYCPDEVFNLGLFSVLSSPVTASATVNRISNLGMNNINITISNTVFGNAATSVGMGGLAGKIYANNDNSDGVSLISKVYVTGEIITVNTSARVSNLGGIFGIADNAIRLIDNSYTIVKISDSNDALRFVGGVVGELLNSGSNPLIGNVYSFSNLNTTSTSVQAGGLGGSDNEVSSIIASSYAVSIPNGLATINGLWGEAVDGATARATYWDNDTSGSNQVADIDGSDNFELELGAQDLTTAQLQGCGLNGASLLANPDFSCVARSGTAIFPTDDGNGNILWGERVINSVTNERSGWSFVEGEYPYLYARDITSNLLPSIAEQRCQRNRFFYDLPCD